jgi:hypothetical protein
MAGIVVFLPISGNDVLDLVDSLHMVGKSQELASLLRVIAFAGR